jgi:hyperosmotically inducible protein
MRLIRNAGCIALIIALGTTIGCSRKPDPTENVSKALRDASLDDVRFTWDEDARIAHLSGSVDTASDRTRAEDIAATAVGTSGKVLNDLTIESAGGTLESADDQISRTLRKLMDDDPILKDRNIDFEIENGVVTVTGEVRTPAERNKVTDLVRAVPAVKDVANALEINPKG